LIFLQDLTGQYLLQIEEAVNVAEPVERRADTRNRFLKLLVTDGHLQIPAIERFSIPGLDVSTACGTKVPFGEDVFATMR